MDAANPLGVGGTSYLCLLSLQTQEVPAHHEVPWGLLVLSGLWVLPCQDLLKVGRVNLTVRVTCHSPQTASPQQNHDPETLLGLCCFSSSTACPTQDQSDPVCTSILPLPQICKFLLSSPSLCWFCLDAACGLLPLATPAASTASRTLYPPFGPLASVVPSALNVSLGVPATPFPFQFPI